MLPRRLMLLASLGLTACGGGLVTFATEQKGEAVIQGNPLGSVLGVFPQMGGFSNIDFDQNQDFKNNSAERHLVQSARVTSLTLRIVSPVDQDFRFLDSVEFAVKAADQEQRIAAKADVSRLELPPPNPTLVLDVADADIAEFIRASSVTFIVRGSGRQPTKDTRLEASVKLLIGVGPP